MSLFSPGPHDLPGVRLRGLEPWDAAALGAVCATLEPYASLGFSATGLAGYLDRDDPALNRFAIETNGALAGVMVLRWPWLRGPFLEMLALLPSAQGQGLGRTVLDWASGQAAAVSANLWTTVSDFNAPARAFYARLGFVEVGALPDLVKDGFGEILLRRRLLGG